MGRDYVEQRDGGLWITGTRVSLDSIVYAYRDGLSPESIQESFPLVSLEQVYGAVAYYLAHKDEVDAYLEEAEAEFEAQRQAAREADPAFYARLEAARRQRQPIRS